MERKGSGDPQSGRISVSAERPNRHGIRGRLSRMLSVMAHRIPRLVYMKKIAIAVATISGIIRRLNISGLSFLAKTAVAQEIRTARVVVWIPPRGILTSADQHEKDHKELAGFPHGGKIRCIKTGSSRCHRLE